MYCTNCGRRNDEGVSFCVYCGTVLESTPKSASYPPGGNDAAANRPPQTQTWYYGAAPQPQYPYGGANTAAPAAPIKKNHKPLILGLIAGGVVFIAAVVLVVVLTAKSAVVGTWYSEERGIVLQFKENGLVISRSAGGLDEGTYTLDENSRTGVIKADEDDYGFTLDVDMLKIDGIGKFKRAEDDFDVEEFIEEY